MFGLVFLAILVIALVFVAPIVGLVWLSRLSGRLNDLTRRIALLEQGPRSAPVSLPDEASSVQVEKTREIQEEPKLPPVDSGREPRAAEAFADQAVASVEAGREPPVSAPAKGPSWEERLAARWMIWLGGLTIALAAVFLFNYAADQGWLTPLIRVVFGLLLGGALLAGGEWTLRAPAEASREALPDYVPPALSASGIFAILVSLFAAHALYGLLDPATAFLVLGLTAYSALVLSLRQGWFVAALGILAGYLVPAMIQSPEANAAATFVYLYVLTFGALALMVWRRWRWFAALAMIGAFAWPVLWTAGPWTVADQGTLGAYALALAASFAALSTRLPLLKPQGPAWAWVAEVLSETSGLGFALAGALLVHVAHVADHNAVAFVLLVGYAALALGMGLWRRSLEGLLPVAALVVMAAVLLWPEPSFVTPPERAQELGLDPVANAFGPYVMPPEFHPFSRALWAFAAVFGLGGFLALWRVHAVAVWAGLSAFVPPLLFAVGYWRIGAFEVDIGWAWWAVGLAAAMLFAAGTVQRRMAPEIRNVPLPFFAAAVTGAVALAFACLFREAWLTVALAAEVAALAWIWSVMKVRELKPVAIAVLVVVVIRLVLNPMVLDYEGGFLRMFGWVVYGYGLPAAASLLAARTFARDGRDLTVTLCEIAGLGFAALMVALQLKLWTSGSIHTPWWGFLDLAVQAIWWTVAGAMLVHKPFLVGRPWARPAGLAILSVAGLTVIFGLLVVNNPLATFEPVGTWPVLNLLGVGYLVPALLGGVVAVSDRFALPDTLRRAISVGAGVLVFADLTLEVRRAFRGTVIGLDQGTWPASAETYAYSAVWTVFALALLALGIARRSQFLRYASLAVLLATVAKVFLYDMSDLTGLFRVASFLGLGLALIGIGRLYRSFVFRPPAGGGEA